MATSRLLAVVCLAWLTVPIVSAEEIVVNSERADVKVWDEVIAEVKQGDRYEVLGRQPGWVAIAVETEQGMVRGWVWANHTRSLVPEESDAPAAPSMVAPGIEFQLDSIQVAYQHKEGQLSLRVSITNTGSQPIAYDSSKFQLKFGHLKISPRDRNSRSGYATHTRIHRTLDNTARLGCSYAYSLKALEQGSIAPQESLEQWMFFPLPDSSRDTDFAIVPCRLQGDLMGHRVDIDLKKSALANLAATPQVSELDPTVPVWEVYGPVNALNYSALQRLLRKHPTIEGPVAVVVARSANFFIDGYVLNELGIRSFSRETVPVSRLTFVPLTNDTKKRPSSAPSSYQPYGNREISTYLSLSNLAVDATIDEAAIRVLSYRDDPLSYVATHLQHADPEVRTSAVLALAHNHQSPEVRDAVLSAQDDRDPRVRAAAVHALVGLDWIESNRRPSFTRTRIPESVDPLVVQAVTDAMTDESENVRNHAARAAARLNDPKAIAGLIELLEDSDQRVVTTAASSLATLTATSAIPALRQLRKSSEENLRATAIRTLQTLGDLTPVEASLAQLTEGNVSYTNFDVLRESRDARAVEPLIAYLQRADTSQHYVDNAAKTLAAFKDKRALEPLLRHLRYGNHYSSEIPRALGRIGDKKAIEPLWEAAGASQINNSRRAAIFEALIDLGAEGALEKVVTLLITNDRSKISVRDGLKAIARSSKPQATEIIAGYLDDPSNFSTAVDALISQDSATAKTLLKQRLFDKDFERGSYLISMLMSKRTPSTVALVRQAMKSPNASTRQSAHTHLRSSMDALQQAREHRLKGELEEARRDCERVLQQQPGFLQAVILLAHLYHEVDSKQAADQYRQAAQIVQEIPRDQRSPADWGYLGQALYRLGDFEQALQALEQSASLRDETEPTVATGPRWWFLTMTLHRLGKHERAQEYYDTLVEQSKGNNSRELRQLAIETATVLGKTAEKLPRDEKLEKDKTEAPNQDAGN